MRRIPRPSRAIDPSLPISPLIQRRIPPPSCLRAAFPHPQVGTTAACFSTTPTCNFLFGGKQDKRAHQAMVRRWQKRILGESEPIGAHVDPYDPTSPVRIAPEEWGEEVEVLDDDGNVVSTKKKTPGGGRTMTRSQKKAVRYAEYKQNKIDKALDEALEQSEKHRDYQPATHGPLLHVGGEEWIEHNEEVELAKEFEKLTMRTYTPMTQAMADQIEKWTGTYYTLRDENLMMAQTFDEATGKPYTEFSFGRSGRVKDAEILRKSFHRAVVEIYALKQAGKELDISKQANRGIYEAPAWIHKVKLQRNGSGEFELAFPPQHSLGTLLAEMEHVPDFGPPAVPEIIEEVVEEELVVEEKPLVQEKPPAAPKKVKPPPPPPIMDPATPAFKRAALVKDDQEKPKFDFMSNRPVPRTPRPEPVKPAEPVVEVVEETVEVVEETVIEEVAVEEPVAVEPTPSTPAIDFDAALATSTSTLSEVRHAVLDSAVRSTEQKISAIRDAIRDSVTSLSSNTVFRVEKPVDVEVKWERVPLTDANVKFALSKRIIQLTGHYISDPNLTSATNLADLYHEVMGVAKAKPTDMYTYLLVEGQRQNQLANQHKGSKVKTRTGDVLKAPNVEILKHKPSDALRRKRTGMSKVIRRELEAQGLGSRHVDQDKVRAERQQKRELERMKGLWKPKEFMFN